MKNIKYLLSIFLFAAAVLGFQSCSDSDSTPAATAITVYKDSLAIQDLSFQVPAAEMILGVDCDADWTAVESDTSWIKISNHAGYGSSTKRSYLRLNIAKNRGDARTGTVTVSSGNLTQVITISQRGTGLDPGDPFESSYSFVENVKWGYNLGNTLDSDPQIGSYFRPHSDLDWETAWGQPTTTQAIIDSLAAQGINVIRIPVTWFPHMDKTWTCRTAWMDRVQEVVDYVLKAGCYCILNVQHDTGTRGTRTDGAGWLRADPDEYEASSVKFKSLWTQIATRFKDYDDHLLFEAFNEILDKEDTWGDATDPQAYTVVNKLEQDFVDAVRATGGNNEYRNLICNPYSAGSTDAKLAGFQVPSDIHTNHIIASLHSYDPYNFCNDNGEYNITEWDSSCEEEIDAITYRVNKRFVDLGIPYIFGEFGAIDEGKDMSERVKYATYVVSKFKSYETKGLWWMGLFNRNTMTWYEPEIVSAIKANL